MDYIARTNRNEFGKLPDGEEPREQLLVEHLYNVGNLSGSFASKFGMSGIGEFLGLLHDIGKYSAEFQNRVRGDDSKVDHTTPGGKVLLEYIESDLFANCIFGHHGGLLNQGNKSDAGNEIRSVFYRKSKEIGDGRTPYGDYSAYEQELKIKNPLKDFQSSCRELQPMPLKNGKQSFTWSFLTRMLFSCLVDADFLDTEKFIRGDVGRGNHDTINDLLAKFNRKIATFKPKKELDVHRNTVLAQCIEKANREKGLFSLTVPTGGGKTYSSMAFALNHANKHGMDRIIYVIPYTSIIEQNAKVFSDIFDEKDESGKTIKKNVLENHSNVEYDNDESSNDKSYLAAENWDIPVVVTTNVQFFESLFSNKTSKTRKLHNIANSVVIFDEAQMLPVDYLKPCVYAIEELVKNYNCTAVLCTATQPSLNLVLPTLSNKIIEISDNYQELSKLLKHVTYEEIGALNNEELVKRLNKHENVLCIVNTRKQAQDIFESLKDDGVYHLSTLMYPEHRKKKLAEIKDRLSKGLTTKVISTSLIEAGVDIDFDTVYRSKAGLDSIIQAGGRCNREGNRMAEASKVYIFEPDPQEYKNPRSLSVNISATDYAIRNQSEMASQDQIQAYFNYLYITKKESLDKKKITERLQSIYIQFEEIANDFKLIEDSFSKTIFIPRDPESKYLLERLDRFGISKSLYRKMSRYTVSIPTYEFEKLKEERVFKEDQGIIVLRDSEAYSDDSGLNIDYQFRADGIFIE